MTRFRNFVVTFCGLLMMAQAAFADDLNLKRRSQKTRPDSPAVFERSIVEETWPAKESAFIVCDVWDAHHCLNAVRRLEEFAPRMNDVLKNARQRGATIIHSPSDCMPAYAGHPARKRAVAAPAAKNKPRDVEFWCSRIPGEEQAVYPLDQSDGGEDDDPAEHAEWAAKLKALGRNPGMPWKMQSKLIEIDAERDFLSDRGDEVWNVLESRGIKNVILVGVHLNMCVLGRPFGLRQMVRNGKRVALMRDLTDCMYNPRRWPYVDHFTGNDLMVAHVERFVCPTITSDQLLGGEAFRSKFDKRPGTEPIVKVTDSRPDWLSVSMDGLGSRVVPEANEHRGPFWMRCVVRLPKDWVGDNRLKLAMGRPARVWLNGQESNASEVWDGGVIAYQLPSDAIALDDANLLVLRVGERDGKLMLPELPILLSGSQKLRLKGRWQLRLGDDKSWSNIPLPAKFGGSTDIFFEPK